MSTTAAPTTTDAPTTTTETTAATSTTAPTTSTSATSTTTSEPVEEATPGYGDWEEFWSVFSQAAASGDVETIDALTADELSFVYAGGSINMFTGPKEDFLGSFARPQEVFDQGRQTFDDGTVFHAELRPPGDWSAFHAFEVAFDMAYSVFIEEGVANPPSASEYIFRKVDGEFLLVGYSVDS